MVYQFINSIIDMIADSHINTVLCKLLQ